MKATKRSKAPFYVDERGIRKSSLSNGSTCTDGLTKGGYTFIQRWEHWACKRGEADRHMRDAGWERRPVLNKVWKSGAQAFKMHKKEVETCTLF